MKSISYLSLRYETLSRDKVRYTLENTFIRPLIRNKGVVSYTMQLIHVLINNSLIFKRDSAVHK